jgi:hypothetical protein
MKLKPCAVGIILVTIFSLCISEESTETTVPPETTASPETTAPPEVTEPPETTAPPTTAPPTQVATTTPSPPKAELVLNEEKTQNNITITLRKIFHVNEPKYGSSGPLEDHLRVELSILNAGSDPIEFYPNITSIIEDNLQNQYVVLSMPSSKNWGGIGSGEPREGHITFPAIDKNAETITLVLRNDTTVIEFTVNIADL